MRKFLAVLLSCFVVLISCFVAPVPVYAVSPPEDYSSIFQNKVIPSALEDVLNSDDKYYLIFYESSDTRKAITKSYEYVYFLVVSDSPIVFNKGSSYFYTSLNFYRSTDGITYSFINNYDLYLAGIDINHLVADKTIWACNHDIFFQTVDFSLSPSDGKFLEYYDYYNNTNYSNTTPEESSGGESSNDNGEDPAWYDVAGWISKVFNSISNFFGGFWTNIQNAFQGFFDSIGQGLSNIGNWLSNFWEGYKAAFVSLWVPSEDAFSDDSVLGELKEKFMTKLQFVKGFQNVAELMGATEGQSLYYEFSFMGHDYAIDFTWYEDYRLTVRASFSALFWVLGFLKLYELICGVFGLKLTEEGPSYLFPM